MSTPTSGFDKSLNNAPVIQPGTSRDFSQFLNNAPVIQPGAPAITGSVDVTAPVASLDAIGSVSSGFKPFNGQVSGTGGGAWPTKLRRRPDWLDNDERVEDESELQLLGIL